MLKKFVLGLVFAVSGLLVWSCGDGSVDPLNDTELLVISRFPSTIDYDLLDSVVNACKKDKECWEKAKKTGEIYKGDYTQILRDDSGNIIIQEGDSAFVWKDGKKLPVFDFSSNSEGDDDDIGSSGSGVTSGSSRIRSSGAGYDEDEYIDEYGPTSGGSGSGTGEVSHDRSSNSNSGSGVSSSIDLSFLSSSSSAKVLSSTTVSHDDKSSSSKRSSSSVDMSVLSSSSSLKVVSSSSIHHNRSSSSKTVVSVNSVAESSSSEEVVELSSSSVSHHTGISSNALACAPQTLKGTCVALPSPGTKGENVTYTFTPAEDNTCNGYNDVEWNVTVENTGASKVHEAYSYNAPQQKYDFVVSFSTVGIKEGVQFSMGGENVVCDPLRIKSSCKVANTFQCNRTKIPADANDNIWKNNPQQISYKWDLVQTAGCFEIKSIDWGGALAGEHGTSVSRTYTSAINQSVSVSITNEEDEVTNVSCAGAYATYQEEVPPNFSVSGTTTFAGEASYKVTPSSITGCNYNSDKCSYELTVTGESTVLASGTYYTGGAITFEGMSTDATVNYTLTLTNYRGSTPKTFSMTYVVAEPKTVTTSMTSDYVAGGKYRLTMDSGVGGNTTFKCSSPSTPTGSPAVVGYINGTNVIKACSEQYCMVGLQLQSNKDYLFIVADNNIPTDMTCGMMGW